MESLENTRLGPKISVIIPSYNQGVFIEETILSIVHQTYKNFEIIVIDGGSTDDTIQVIKKYAHEIKYWVSEKDKGQSHAVNKGIQIAAGDFICWQNSDDVFWPGAFDFFVKAYQKHPNYDVYFGHQAIIDKVSKTKFINYFVPFSVSHLRYLGWNITNQSTFFKASVLKENQLDETLQYAMDYDLYLKLGTQKFKFFLLNQIIGGLREYAATKSQTYSRDLILNEYKRVILKYYKNEFKNSKLIKIKLKMRYYYYLMVYHNLFKWLKRILIHKVKKIRRQPPYGRQDLKGS